MIPYPKLKASPRSRQKLEVFRGLNRARRIGEGEFAAMENLTSDDFPVLSSRKARGLVAVPEGKCLGMIQVPGKGLFLAVKMTDAQGRDYASLQLLTADGEQEEVMDSLSAEPKSFALMGNYLAIAPDMYVVKLEKKSTGEYSRHPMGASWKLCLGQITIEACDMEGNVLEVKTVSPTPPGSPGYRELWLDMTVPATLKQYDSDSRMWVSLESTYLKLSGLGDHPFRQQDGIQITDLQSDTDTWVNALNGTHVIENQGHGYIVIAGLITKTHTQDTGIRPVTLERKVPRLDFMVEAGNRLWGCARDVNEIYACKLGDFWNWNCYQGLSTDSYTATVGSPGRFTGAVNQGGYPIFYKEGFRHKVWPSSTGAHQITSAPWLGVEEGSCGSIALSEGTVFYKSPNGICADDGGGAVLISQCLGDGPLSKGVGAVHEGKYYVALNGCAGVRSLYVYDLRRKLWHREDGQDIDFLASGAGLYCWKENKLWDLTGKTGTPEQTVSWMAETGDLGLELPDRKYISRLTLRLMLPPGSRMDLEVCYDREPRWTRLGTVYGTDLNSFSLPLRPRRCDQLRLRLSGIGEAKIYSITKTLEKGSELP